MSSIYTGCLNEWQLAVYFICTRMEFDMSLDTDNLHYPRIGPCYIKDVVNSYTLRKQCYKEVEPPYPLSLKRF